MAAMDQHGRQEKDIKCGVGHQQPFDVSCVKGRHESQYYVEGWKRDQDPEFIRAQIGSAVMDEIDYGCAIGRIYDWADGFQQGRRHFLERLGAGAWKQAPEQDSARCRDYNSCQQ